MPTKPCPVDRGKLLIGLECCHVERYCAGIKCPYWKKECATSITGDALAYINYLEGMLNAKADGSD